VKKGWTTVALGEVFQLDLDSVPVDPSVTYEMAGVLSYGRGLFEKPPVSGAATSYKTFYRLKAGQIVLSQLFGWEGAIAPVSPECEGRFVSSQFPTFRPNSNLDAGFARWLIRNPQLWDQLRAAAKGMGDRRRTLSPDIFLAATSVMPPFAEQQRITAHLDSLEARLTRVRKLRQEQEQQLYAALRSAFHSIEAKSGWVEMGEVAPLVRREVIVDPEGSYPELGIRSFGKGTFHKPRILGIETTKHLFEIHAGDLVFNNVFAWEGAVAVAQIGDHGRLGSHRFLTCVCDRSRITPEILHFYFLTAAGLEKLGKASPGGAGRNRTLGIERLAKIQVPVPSVTARSEFMKLLELERDIRQNAQEAKAQLESLFSSLLDLIFNGKFISKDIEEIQLGLSGIPANIIDVSRLLRQKAALSAYFVYQSGQDKYRGRVKMEKFDQFVEAECGLDLGRTPQALAAGPADMASRESVEAEAQKNGWYSVQRFNDSNSRTHYEYFAGKNISEAISIAEKFMGDRKPAVDRLIKLLKPLNTHQCSVIATLHSAWKGLFKTQTPVSNDRIIAASIHSHPEKQKISMADWNWGLNWLRTNNFVPKG
jgi:type I restriction enzyme S subunit